MPARAVERRSPDELEGQIKKYTYRISLNFPQHNPLQVGTAV
jgi:hypothetical protein